MRAHLVGNWSGLDQYALVEHALAALRARRHHHAPAGGLLDMAEAVQHPERLAHGVAAEAERLREPRLRRQRIAGPELLGLDEAADFLRRLADHALAPDRGGAVGHC